jgi:hypothetical protein
MKYVANPVVVEAFIIQKVLHQLNDKNLHLTLDNGIIVTADVEMTARYIPKPGDYWVRQEDGYVYLNPKEVFERKYAPKFEPESKESL